MTEDKIGIKSIEYLTEDGSLIDLCKRYWEQDHEGEFRHTTSTLAKECGIPTNQVSKLVSANCQVYLKQFSCSSCGTDFIVTNRTEYKKRIDEIKRGKKFVCRKCQDKQAQLEAERKAAEKEEMRRLIREQYGKRKPDAVDPRSLSFDNAVYLLAVIRAGAYEKLTAIRPLDLFETLLSPTRAYDIEILRQLYYKDLLFVHPESSPDAFDPPENGKVNTFYLNLVTWFWPASISSQNNDEKWRLAADIEEIFKSGNWPENWREGKEHLHLWRKVALHECFQYLDHSMSEHRFSFNPGEKTVQTFAGLLDDFSVGQMYNFIWRAAKDAAAYYQRGGVSKQQAANSIVGAVQRYGERAKAEGWEVKPYRRIPQCPQSMVSQVLFTVALGIGDDWISIPIKNWADHNPAE